jgi:predicted extracellular nuclease
LGSPDIIAVQEVQDNSGPEDDGTVRSDVTLSRLVRAIEVAGGVSYDVRSIDPEDGADGGQPGANIRNAFLFNPRRVGFPDRGERGEEAEAMIAGSSFTGSNPGLIAAHDPAFARREDGRGGSRKPLIGEFRFAGRSLYLVNLHLVSKGGDDPFFGRRQPPRAASTDHRLAQAEAVARFVDRLLEGNPEAQVVVLGDLNDFEDSIPIRALEEIGLEDLIKRLPRDDRYSYVYQGSSQVLDHILISPALAGGAEVDAVHCNAEFPSARRSSDHDPVVVRLVF